MSSENLVPFKKLSVWKIDIFIVLLELDVKIDPTLLSESGINLLL